MNSHTGVGYFKTEDTSKPQLFMFCQADPKEYTQGFKMAVQWRNGSMLFVDDGKVFTYSFKNVHINLDLKSVHQAFFIKEFQTKLYIYAFCFVLF